MLSGWRGHGGDRDRCNSHKAAQTENNLLWLKKTEGRPWGMSIVGNGRCDGDFFSICVFHSSSSWLLSFFHIKSLL